MRVMVTLSDIIGLVATGIIVVFLLSAFAYEKIKKIIKNKKN